MEFCQAAGDRYAGMSYRYCGKSGLQLPAISLGLWHNFGAGDSFEEAAQMVYTAFDHGITHFDLANNYGPPPGAAERSFGLIFGRGLRLYRDEIIISTKAGHEMWSGPYGNWGSPMAVPASTVTSSVMNSNLAPSCTWSIRLVIKSLLILPEASSLSRMPLPARL